MIFRVFDEETKRPVSSRVLLSPDGDLLTFERKWFRSGLRTLPDNRYILHRFTYLHDKHGKDLFEGDICIGKDGAFTGIVTYIQAHAAFYLIDDLDHTYYPLSVDCEHLIEIVGNVVQNPEMVATAHVE